MVESMELQTASEVIDALGGNAALADLTCSKSSAISNWRAFGKFPAKFYLVMTLALAEKGLRAPVSLWGMIEAPETTGASS